MASVRDYAAEYARRVARGLERGLRPSDAAGQTKRSERSTPRVPRESTITGTDDRGKERSVRVIQSADRRFVVGEIRRAAARDDSLIVYAVWQTDAGHGTQVFAGPKQGRGRAHSHREGEQAEGKFRIIIGTRDDMVALTGQEGMPAAQVIVDLSQRDQYGNKVIDNFDDYLADWWDDEEGEEDGS